jgi:hypothetical protein
MHSYLCCLEGDEVRVLCFGNTVDDSAEHTTSKLIQCHKRIVRDYNPTHPLGFGTEEPHPLPPPTKSDEIPVVGSSPEAIGMKWVITFRVDNNPERIHFHFAFQQLNERSENVVGLKNFDCSLRVNSATQRVSGVVQWRECVRALQELETLMQLRVRNPSDGFVEG